MTNPLYNLFRWIVFKVGDTRWIGFKYFPFVATWDAYHSKIDQAEVHDAMKVIRPGDLIVLRHDGYLSNLGIGGAMIHAALYIGADECVEALSDDEGGVCKNHIADTMHADMAMILRPELGPFEISEAIRNARSILGFKYDVLFDFNTEEERDYIKKFPDKAKDEIKFCCTEVPHYCYLDYVDQLQIYRVRQASFMQKILAMLGLHTGHKIITADMYVTANFRIVWASKHCTPERFSAMGCEEHFIKRVEQYWTESPCKCKPI